MSDTAGQVKIKIGKAARKALRTNLTARLLVDICHHFKSRNGADVIAWAENLVEELNPAILKAINLETKSSTYQLNLVTMQNKVTDVFICYDIFIDGCDDTIKAHIDQTLDEQPIYKIVGGEKSYSVLRAAFYDEEVARAYAEGKSTYGSPRPFFADLTSQMFLDQIAAVREENT